MTATVTIGIVALICLSATTVSVAVTFRKALSLAFRALDSSSATHEKQMESLMNRLMTVRWEDFATLQTMVDTGGEDGGFFSPEEQKGEVEQTMPKPAWATLSRLRASMSREEEELLAEDFDEDDVPRRAAE